MDLSDWFMAGVYAGAAIAGCLIALIVIFTCLYLIGGLAVIGYFSVEEKYIKRRSHVEEFSIGEAAGYEFDEEASKRMGVKIFRKSKDEER